MAALTDDQENALELYKEFGREHLSVRAFSRRTGIAKSSLDRWMKLPEFAERIQELRASFSEQEKAEKLAVEKAKTTARGAKISFSHRARREFPELPLHQAKFLSAWRETKDRTTAAAQAKKSWSELELELDRDPAFADAFAQVEAEFLVAVEDAALRDAIQGKGGTARTNLLEAQSRKFSKIAARRRMNGEGTEKLLGFTDYDVEAARARARELYERCMAPPIESQELDGADHPS